MEKLPLIESNTVQTITLTNSIIGVGILSMPYCFSKCGILLSIVLLLFSSYITRLSCHYLLCSAIISKRKNFEQIGSYAFGSIGKLLAELCVIGYLLGTCIAYFVVVGDLGPQITAKIFSLNNQSDTLRPWVMCIVTVVCIMPLGMLRNVDSLASVCTASLGFYVCLAMKVISEASTNLLQGNWYDNIELWKPEGILQCLPIFSMALSCQMQLFEVYGTMPTFSLDKMNKVVRKSTAFCASVYALIGFFGYIAFSKQKFSGNIIVNFSESFVSDIIKIGFVLSVAFSFPLAIFPCRVSLYSLLFKRSHSDAHYIPDSKFKPLTICIILLSLMIGLMIPSIEVVIGLVGSTIGVGICLIFPALCYVRICKAYSTEKTFAQAMVVFGCSVMILGTMANLNAIDQSKTSSLQKIVNIAEEPEQIPLIPTEMPKLVDPDDFKKEVINELSNKTSGERPVPKIVVPVQEKERPFKIPNVADIPKKVDEKPETVVKKYEEKEEANKPYVEKMKEKEKAVIEKDAILKEDQEIAIEAKDEKRAMEKELKELKDANKVLEEQVNVMKDVIVKKNEETQQLVLKKFEEIAEKIDNKKDEKSEEKLKDETKIENEVEKENAETTQKTLDKIVEDLAKFIDEQKKDMPAQEDQKNNAQVEKKVEEKQKEVPEEKKAEEQSAQKSENEPQIVVQKDPIIKLLTDKQKNLTNAQKPDEKPEVPQIKPKNEVDKTEIIAEKTIVTIDKTANESERIKRATEVNEKAESLENKPKIDLNDLQNNNIVMQEKEFRRRRKR